jgi:RND family efflux transporter MFP subunit
VKKINILTLLLCSLSAVANGQAVVSVVPLSELAVYPDRFAPATVVSLNQPMLSAQITAQIDQVPVRVGDMVTAGDVLVKLDCSDYELGREASEASLESTEARYELAQLNLERAQSLVANQLISIESLDSSRTELSALSAELKASRANLNINRLQESRCDIKAPFDALVLERLASVGQLATPGTPVASILDLGSVEISAQIFSGDTAQFNEYLKLQFEANSRLYPVKLTNLVAALDSATRNQEARLVFTEEPALPGSSGKIIWNDPRVHLPASYLVERGGQLGFFVSDRNKARFHVIPAAQPGRLNPVDEPLGLMVVTEGYAGLSEGDELNIEQSQ